MPDWNQHDKRHNHVDQKDGCHLYFQIISPILELILLKFAIIPIFEGKCIIKILQHMNEFINSLILLPEIIWDQWFQNEYRKELEECQQWQHDEGLFQA